MDYQIKVLKDKKIAEKVGEFLVSENAFDQTWTPKEKEMVKKAVIDSLIGKNHNYWYVFYDRKIIAAMRVRENKYGSNGYEMDSDYLAVHKDYRKKGIASALLNEMEKYVKKNKGRYIHVLTCDIDSYKPALNFYEKHGYKKMMHLPNYYVKGEGRIDYYKEI